MLLTAEVVILLSSEAMFDNEPEGIEQDGACIFPGLAAARRCAAARPPRENASSLKKESARVAKRCSDFTDKILHPQSG